MIMREVVIQAEYTSEDGLVFWVRGKKRNKKREWENMEGLGHDSLSEAIKHVKSMMKHGR